MSRLEVGSTAARRDVVRHTLPAGLALLTQRLATVWLRKCAERRALSKHEPFALQASDEHRAHFPASLFHRWRVFVLRPVAFDTSENDAPEARASVMALR